MVRLAALVALVAGIVVVAAVVTASIDGGRDGGGGKKKRDRGAAITNCEPEYENAVEDGYYIVQEGDLLSLIAARTCVEEEELNRLNPDVDPQALTPGQCVNLAQRGCDKRDS